MKHRKLLIGSLIGCTVLLAGAALYVGCAVMDPRHRPNDLYSGARNVTIVEPQQDLEISQGDSFQVGWDGTRGDGKTRISVNLVDIDGKYAVSVIHGVTKAGTSTGAVDIATARVPIGLYYVHLTIADGVSPPVGLFAKDATTGRRLQATIAPPGMGDTATPGTTHTLDSAAAANLLPDGGTEILFISDAARTRRPVAVTSPLAGENITILADDASNSLIVQGLTGDDVTILESTLVMLDALDTATLNTAGSFAGSMGYDQTYQFSEGPITGTGAPGFVQLPELWIGTPHSENVASESWFFLADAPSISVGGGGGGWGGSAAAKGSRPVRNLSPTEARRLLGQDLKGNRWIGFGPLTSLGATGHDDAVEKLQDFLARLSSADEIWIIEKTAFPVAATRGEGPGCGALLARLPGQTETVPVPLKHTDVQARISGYIATVEVTQEFHNPFSEKIEAVYVFPLPQNSAVNEFLMTIGERTIRGIIREREEAARIYAAARQQGHVASLLTQERPNIFTQKVANIEPGKEIDINIKYFNTLAYVDGSYEFVFPMVVGPRFNPPGMTDGVGAVARGQNGISGQSTEVQYLAPHERSGHDITLSVEIDAGVEIEDLTSPTHVIEVEQDASEFAAVRLSELDTIPNKDFVLRYKVAGDSIKSTLLTHRDERGGFFTLMLFPPDDLSALRRQPTEMIFVLDCSGSMSGAPIAKAKAAMERALKRLQPDDTFQIIRFSNNASQLGPAPLLATVENVQRGLDYVRSLNGNGGTMMIEGIKAALDFPHDRDRLRLVSFMTDGFIGNEAQIFGEVYQRLGDARIFSFGVGTSVNRHLLEGLARLGHGAVAYVGLDDSAGEAVDLFYERISHPAMTDIEIDWGGMEVSDVYPREIPDLFVGRPVVLTGRFEGDGPADIRVTGRCGAEEREIALTADLEDESATHAGIPSVWARTQIRHLADRMTRSDDFELPLQIREVAFEYNLMSKYTSFVAVDSKTITAGDHGITLGVPVPVPEGVRYDTTVSE